MDGEGDVAEYLLHDPQPAQVALQTPLTSWEHIQAEATSYRMMDTSPMQCWWTTNSMAIFCPMVASCAEDGTPVVTPFTHVHPCEPRDYPQVSQPSRMDYFTKPQGVGVDTVLTSSQLPAGYRPLNVATICAVNVSPSRPFNLLRLSWSAFCSKSVEHQQRITRLHKMIYDRRMMEFRKMRRPEEHSYNEREESLPTAERQAREALIRQYNLTRGRAASQPAVDGWFHGSAGERRADGTREGRFHIVYQNVNSASGALAPSENYFLSRHYAYTETWDEETKAWVDPKLGGFWPDSSSEDSGYPFFFALTWQNRYSPEYLAAEAERDAVQQAAEEARQKEREEEDAQRAAEEAASAAEKEAAQAAADEEERLAAQKKAAEEAEADAQAAAAASAAVDQVASGIARIQLVQSTYQAGIAALWLPTNTMDPAAKAARMEELTAEMNAGMEAAQADM